MEKVYRLEDLVDKIYLEHSSLFDERILDKVCDNMRSLWKWGIERIVDESIRMAVESYYCSVVPLQFFIAPSSTSGAHHPSWHNESGGIVRHLVECCVSTDRMLQAFGFVHTVGKNDKEKECIDLNARDKVLAATVISDTFKNGLRWGKNGLRWGNETVKNHGEVAARFWRIHASRYLGDGVRDEIAQAVHWHYGRYTPVPKGCKRVELEDLPKLTQVVHLLDMCSSDENNAIIYRPVEILPYPESVRRAG